MSWGQRLLVPFIDRDLTRQLEGLCAYRPPCWGHQGPGNREALLTEIPAPPTTAPPASGLWQVWPWGLRASSGVDRCQTPLRRWGHRGSEPGSCIFIEPRLGAACGPGVFSLVSHLSMYPSVWGPSPLDPACSVILCTRSTLFRVAFKVSRGSWAPRFLSSQIREPLLHLQMLWTVTQMLRVGQCSLLRGPPASRQHWPLGWVRGQGPLVANIGHHLQKVDFWENLVLSGSVRAFVPNNHLCTERGKKKL